MVSPKEKVRANIYKILLEEEKTKNKRKNIFTLSVFFVGIFTGTSYTNLIKPAFNSNSEQVIALNREIENINTAQRKNSIELKIDDLFQANEMLEIGEVEFDSENLFVTELQI